MRSYVSAVAPSIDTWRQSRPLATHAAARRSLSKVKFEFVVTRIPFPAAYDTMSKKRGCIIGSPSPCRCNSRNPAHVSIRPVNLSKAMNASGP